MSKVKDINEFKLRDELIGDEYLQVSATDKIHLKTHFDKVNTRIEETNTKVNSIENTIDSLLEDNLMYGIQWTKGQSNTACTRIGNPLLHQTLPIHSKMRGCLLDDDGNVVEYLPYDWSKAVLDGSRGQVMVEIPEHYRKFETNGLLHKVKISEHPIKGYHKVPIMYISAYEASLQRSTSKLSSVVNKTTDYRGGDNNSSFDNDSYRSLLGRPVTDYNLGQFRTYARNRNTSDRGWNIQDYRVYKAIFWLYYVEYANRNCQLDFNSAKDTNGYSQGGLGMGVTEVNPNTNKPFIPCGFTNSLGNGSGVVPYSFIINGISQTILPNRYRGIENPFGHIWKIMDGILIDNTDYYTYLYIANDLDSYGNLDKYVVEGTLPRYEGFVYELLFGDRGNILPMSLGGSSSSQWADYHFTSLYSRGIRMCCTGGALGEGVLGGLAFLAVPWALDGSSTVFGTRLCYIPKTSVEDLFKN